MHILIHILKKYKIALVECIEMCASFRASFICAHVQVSRWNLISQQHVFLCLNNTYSYLFRRTRAVFGIAGISSAYAGISSAYVSMRLDKTCFYLCRRTRVVFATLLVPRWNLCIVSSSPCFTRAGRLLFLFFLRSLFPLFVLRKRVPILPVQVAYFFLRLARERTKGRVLILYICVLILLYIRH